jgi:hypothetical protein
VAAAPPQEIASPMDFDIALSMLGMIILTETFPHLETLEAAVAARIMQGLTIRTSGKEQKS